MLLLSQETQCEHTQVSVSPEGKTNATNIPSKKPADKCIWEGTTDPITYNSKPSFTQIFWSRTRHKAQSKLWLHLGYFFSCVVHSKWQIHI